MRTVDQGKLQEALGLAYLLAKSGLVQDVAGLPDFDRFAEADLAVDPRVFTDLEERVKVFKRAWERIEEGAKALDARQITAKEAVQAIKRYVRQDYHVFEWWGDQLAFSESKPSDNYTTMLPIDRKGAPRRDERVRVTFTDVGSVARQYALFADGEPVTGPRFAAAWTALKSADDAGVLYRHTYHPRRGHEDVPALTYATREFIKYGRAKTLLSANALQRAEQLVDAIPGMHARERVRERLLAGEEGWKLADRFAEALASRPETPHYTQLLNIFGTGTWHKGSGGPYFTEAPDFSTTPPRDPPGTVRNALERSLAGNHRDMFKGYDFAFAPRNVEYDLKGFVDKGDLGQEQAIALQKQAGEFVKHANRLFAEF